MCVIAFTAFFSVGILYIRSYMIQQTVEERTAQLEEMIAQIRTNLEHGMETHWNFLCGIEKAMGGKHYADDKVMMEDIAAMEEEFCTELYGCRLMLLDSMGMAYLDDGEAGIWDDINRLSDGDYRNTFVTDTSNVDGTFLAFSQKLENPVTIGENGQKCTHLVMLKSIETLKKYYTTESYGGNAATYIILSLIHISEPTRPY